MAELTHVQYDLLERAVVDGTRVAIRRRGREYVVIPRLLHAVGGREAIEARNPTTGFEMTIYVDEIERMETVR